MGSPHRRRQLEGPTPRSLNCQLDPVSDLAPKSPSARVARSGAGASAGSVTGSWAGTRARRSRHQNSVDKASQARLVDTRDCAGLYPQARGVRHWTAAAGLTARRRIPLPPSLSLSLYGLAVRCGGWGDRRLRRERRLRVAIVPRTQCSPEARARGRVDPTRVRCPLDSTVRSRQNDCAGGSRRAAHMPYLYLRMLVESRIRCRGECLSPTAPARTPGAVGARPPASEGSAPD